MVKRTVTKRTTVTGDERIASAAGMYAAGASFVPTNHPGGRWPPNILLTHSAACLPSAPRAPGACAPDCPVHQLDVQSGPAGAAARASSPTGIGGSEHGIYNPRREGFRVDGEGSPFYKDTGGASRFFPQLNWDPELDDIAPFLYQAKASRSEREAGCEKLPARKQDETREEGAPGGENPRNRGAKARRNHHPTVKPVAVMRWLVRLLTPPRGIVLDPFMGTATTGVATGLEGVRFAGIELEPEYLAIGRARIDHWRPK